MGTRIFRLIIVSSVSLALANLTLRACELSFDETQHSDIVGRQTDSSSSFSVLFLLHFRLSNQASKQGVEEPDQNRVTIYY